MCKFTKYLLAATKAPENSGYFLAILLIDSAAASCGFAPPERVNWFVVRRVIRVDLVSYHLKAQTLQGVPYTSVDYLSTVHPPILGHGWHMMHI